MAGYKQYPAFSSQSATAKLAQFQDGYRGQGSVAPRFFFASNVNDFRAASTNPVGWQHADQPRRYAGWFWVGQQSLGRDRSRIIGQMRH
jgi:hypothetical protein